MDSQSTTSVNLRSSSSDSSSPRSKPQESAESYFPPAPVIDASPSAQLLVTTTFGQPAPPVRRLTSHIGPYPLSAMDLEYAEPTDELDVEKQLSKPPLPRSVHSSLKAAATMERKKVMEGAATKARRLAEAKKEWASWAR